MFTRREFLEAFASLLLVRDEAPPMFPACDPAPASRVLLEICSEFSLIRVNQKGSLRELVFVDGRREFVESRVDIVYPHRLRDDYTRDMLAALLFVPQARRVLMLGLGGGVVTNSIHARLPNVEVTGVDIDPCVISVAQSHFFVPVDDPKYRVFEADAAAFLARDAQARYDVLLIDIFKGGTSPPHLQTLNFYAACLGALSARGIVVIHLHQAAPDYAATRESLAEVFPFECILHCTNELQVLYIGAAFDLELALADGGDAQGEFEALFGVSRSALLSRISS